MPATCHLAQWHLPAGNDSRWLICPCSGLWSASCRRNPTQRWRFLTKVTCAPTPDNARCKKLAKAGAVRLKWPEDRSRDVPEPESYTWNILQEATWNADVHLGWRFTAAELAKRADERAHKRQK